MMKKRINWNRFIISYSVVVLILAVILRNIEFIILSASGLILLLFLKLYMVYVKKKYTKIIEQYNYFVDIGDFDSLLDFLFSFRKAFYIRVLIAQTYLYKGDEYNYLRIYEKSKDYRKKKTYYYKLLHHTYSYYRFIKDGEILPMPLDDSFPLSTVLNLYIKGDYSTAYQMLLDVHLFKTAFMNYLVEYLRQTIKVKLSNSKFDFEELKKHTSKNDILSNHFKSLL
jgi:hypothetical protein